MMAALKTRPTRKGQLKNIVLQNLLNFSESSEEEQTFVSASDGPASIPVKQGDVRCCTQVGEKENALKTTTTLSNEEDPKSGGTVVTEKKTISVDRRQNVHSKTKSRCADLQKRVGGSQAERKKKSMSAKPKAKTSLQPQNVTLADLGISCDFSESSDSGEEGRFGKGQPQKHKADLPLKVKERAKHKKLVPATVLKLQAPDDDAGVEGEREELGGRSKPSEQSPAAGIEALHAADVCRRQTQSSTVSKPASSSDYKQPSDDAGIKVSQSIQKNVTEMNSKSVKSTLKKLATTEKPHERGMKNLQITDKEKDVNSDIKFVKCPAPLQHPDVSLIRSAHFGSSILALASPSEESLLPLSESTRLDCPENFSAAKQSFGHLLASHNSPRVFESSKGDSRNSYEQLGIVRKAAVGSQMKCSHAPREEGQTSGMAEGASDESGRETSESELQYITCLATPDASSMYEAVDVSVQTSFKFGVCASTGGNHGAAVSPVSADRHDDPNEDSSAIGAVAAADNVRLSEPHKQPEDGAETRGHDQGLSKLAAQCVTPSDLKSIPTAVSTKMGERCAGGEELSDSSPGADSSKEANCLKTEEGAASLGEGEEAADSMPPQTLEADSKAPADSNYFSDSVSCVNTTSGSPDTHGQLQTGDHGPLDSLPQELHSLKLSGSVSEEDDATERGQCKGGESITGARQKSAASETSMATNSKPRRGCSEDNHTGAECRSSAVWRNRRLVDSSSEEDDDQLEAFFQKTRNPDQPAEKVPENDNLDDFIVDDSDVTDSEEVVSDSDDESVASLCTDFGTESLPRTRSARQEVPKLESMQDDYGLGDSRSDEEKNESCSFGHDGDGEEDDEFLGLKTPKSKIRPAFSRSQTPCEGSLTWYTPATSMKTRPPRQERPAASTFSVSSTRVLGSASRREDVWATPMCTPRTGSTTKLKPLGFLRSLSSDVPDHLRDQEARSYIIHFKRKQEELSSRLFKLFNSTVFENQLPADLPVVWNKRLLKTSGLCKQKRVNDAYTATIELSIKVCDSPERVRDTVVHEMCHAAVWILNKAKEGHGPHWKFWAAKANRIHPEIPMIRRCHDYSINTKYIYRCVDCGYQLGRHSKSLDTEGKVCGRCHGRFQLLTSGKATSQTATPRTPNPFAMFVKENYGSVKRSGGGLPHKQVMEALSRQFAQTKVNFS